jgi:hypothetical protein
MDFENRGALFAAKHDTTAERPWYFVPSPLEA